VSGGDTVLMNIPFANVSLNNISKDKTELLVGNFTGAEVDQPLWIVPVVGGTPRRFVDLPGEDGTWLANGNLLISNENKLIEITPGAGNRTFVELPPPFLTSWFLRWSPDGRKLRLTVGSAVHNQIWEASSDGKQFRQILADWKEAEDPLQGNWTPDGKYYIFQASHPGRSDLWAIREEGDLFHRVNHEPVQLTAGPLSYYSPQPSADGKKIFAIGAQRRAELVRYDSKTRQFLPYLGGISASNLSFSRDGQWLTYVTYPEQDVWRSRIDGSEKLQIMNADTVAGWSPAISPSGTKIAFIGWKSGGSRDIYVTSLAGGTAKKIPTGEIQGAIVGWCGDGKLVMAQGEGVKRVGTVLIDVETAAMAPLADSQDTFLSVCSPDEKHLVARTIAGDKLKLYDSSTQKWSELATRSIGMPKWSPDSRYVYFDSGSGTEQAVYRVRIADRKLEQVADLKDFRRTVEAWVSWMGLAPDGSPLFTRDVGSQEVYALDFEEP
jgi:Tol biopolymer transport system component